MEYKSHLQYSLFIARMVAQSDVPLWPETTILPGPLPWFFLMFQVSHCSRLRFQMRWSWNANEKNTGGDLTGFAFSTRRCANWRVRSQLQSWRVRWSSMRRITLTNWQQLGSVVPNCPKRWEWHVLICARTFRWGSTPTSRVQMNRTLLLVSFIRIYYGFHFSLSCEFLLGSYSQPFSWSFCFWVVGGTGHGPGWEF